MSSLETLVERVQRIEDKLFGNGDSLLERIAALEVQQRELMRKFEEKAVLDTNDLLRQLNEKYDGQLIELRRNSNIAIIGLIVTVLLTVLGGAVAKALGWL